MENTRPFFELSAAAPQPRKRALKIFKIRCSYRSYYKDDHREKIVSGTLAELTERFKYKLENGASWESGGRKVNCNPRTAAGLVNALNNAVYNTQGSCYNRDFYALLDE